MSPFVDTNILVYAFGDDWRHDPAQTVIKSGVCLSVQVLNEFTDVVRRQNRWPWSKVSVILSGLDHVLDSVLPLTVEAQALGIEIGERHQLRIYDACIIASASLAGCKMVFTEDLNHGQTIEGVRIVNPFL
jgi:predicted nucleic acid-binding protein